MGGWIATLRAHHAVVLTRVILAGAAACAGGAAGALRTLQELEGRADRAAGGASGVGQRTP